MGVYVPVIDIPGNAGSASKLANDSGSAPSYACRAWVNFNGTGTVAIRASGNVSSITDNGVGDYTVNFTTAMPDTNFAVTQAYTPGSSHAFVAGVLTMATGSVRMTPYLNYANGTALDMSMVSVAVFR